MKQDYKDIIWEKQSTLFEKLCNYCGIFCKGFGALMIFYWIVKLTFSFGNYGG